MEAAQDRAHAAAERKANEVDALTARGAALRDSRTPARDRPANRGDGRLIAVYVDVDGLGRPTTPKAITPGDLMLKHIVAVLQTHLRSYEPIVRVGGDEFVCTISATTIENVRARFAQITVQLNLTPGRRIDQMVSAARTVALSCRGRSLAPAARRRYCSLIRPACGSSW